jgi:hypothetical protein
MQYALLYSMPLALHKLHMQCASTATHHTNAIKGLIEGLSSVGSDAR